MPHRTVGSRILIRSSSMKVLAEVTESGLESLLGQRVTLFCVNYIYTGMLYGVNTSFVQLREACIVYETGPLLDGNWKDAQKLPNDWFVQLSAVESFGILK